MDLVFSDIHADILALNAIIDLTSSIDFQKKYGKISRIINLGDVLERGTNPRKVLKKLRVLSQDHQLISVMGNHDEAFLYKKEVSGNSFESILAHKSLSEKDLRFFTKNQDLTYGKQDFIDKKNGIVCVHGGPLDPKKITPKDAGESSWFYQKTWQRLSDSEDGISPYGYFYKASDAFFEVNSKIKNPIILCGHEHIEAAIKQNLDGIQEILSITKPKSERLSTFVVEKKEILIEKDNSYLIRMGLGGPEGYYGLGNSVPHFGIIQNNPKKVILFKMKS